MNDAFMDEAEMMIDDMEQEYPDRQWAKGEREALIKTIAADLAQNCYALEDMVRDVLEHPKKETPE